MSKSMAITPEQRETISVALDRLYADPAFELPIAAIRQILDRTWEKRVLAQRAEYVAANKMAANPAAMLSGSARDWWEEARQALAYGRLALSRGSRASEKALSRKCEKLDESFEARVPVQERGMFKFHDLTDGPGWDDRWHCCMDFNFPLLREEFCSGPMFTNPMREAQISVLNDALGKIPDSAKGSAFHPQGWAKRFLEANRRD